jgi:hypothetical protein
MCNFIAAAGMQLLGGGVQAWGANMEGRNKERYYQHLADQNEGQALATERTAETQETLIQDQAARDVHMVRQRGRQIAASQRVALAANGIGGGSATAEDLARDSLSREELDEMAIRYSADMKSWETRNQGRAEAWDLRNQAHFNRVAGKQARIAGTINTWSSLLGGASQAAGSLSSAQPGQSRKG